MRDERMVSREKLAFNAGVSSSYITHLENGNRDRPTREVLHALVRYLDRIGPLSAVEHRHLLDLAGLGAGEYPDAEQLRAWITTDMHHALTLHEPNLAAYFDTRWNLLACNDSFAQAFPGIAEQGNFLHWFLGNAISRRTVVEWEQEVRLLVHWLRGLLAGSGDAAASVAFLAELAQYEQFCRIWDEEAVAYGRDRPLLHLRDLDTGTRRGVVVQMFRVDSVPHSDRIQIFLGIPVDSLAPVPSAAG
ncbi:helix-turn-helix domain-containing protein [Nocardia huaxiensis]|uniref:MmyB family transcriptional regulator n=1 Tax=Nocardia huaxiensis TaxID=2755382 RepID=UPI001E600D9E|nr:helix-turn-helix domain-containing protein [Nocardia huaxiensis]UFS93236.1 helix-turn-helix transcriptional regulator [Nocardia huaxiensis]